MDEQTIKQIFDELLTSLEPLETNSVALINFIKAKGLATDEELAPFLEQAGNAANIRWLAVRVRTDALISNATKPSEPEKESAAPELQTAPSHNQELEKEGAAEEQNRPKEDRKGTAENRNGNKERATKSSEESPQASRNDSDQEDNAA